MYFETIVDILDFTLRSRKETAMQIINIWAILFLLTYVKSISVKKNLPIDSTAPLL